MGSRDDETRRGCKTAMRASALYQIESAMTLDEVERGLQELAVRHQFGVVAIHDLQDALKKRNLDLTMSCRIYEVCNPRQAKKVLEANGAVSTALPCRIWVYGSQGRYTLARCVPPN